MKLIKPMLQRFGIAAVLLALLSIINSQLSTARAQGTAFVFQGWLTNNDVPRASGRHYIRFRLADSATGTNYLGPSITNNVMVQALQFTATLDFGNQFTNGASRWLEISVAKNYHDGIYSIMTPRVLLSPVTSAIYAETASNLLGDITVAQLPGNVLTNEATGVTLSGTFAGNGAGLMALNPMNLSAGTADISINGNAATATSAATAGVAATAILASNVVSGISITNLTLNGALNLSALPVTIDSGTNLLLRADNDDNFFAGLGAGNLTTSGNNNTANGDYALEANTSGSENTANGYGALNDNTIGSENTANGNYALLYNTSGNYNTANGADALQDNITGSYNTANGFQALYDNTSGYYNTANGFQALLADTSGNNNTALGYETLHGLTSGANNIALGYEAGNAFTNNESDNIDIGNEGIKGESGVIRIGTPGIQTNAYIAGVIIGNGGGLTNLNAAQLTGIVPLAQLPTAVVTTNESTVTLDNLDLNGAVTADGGITAKDGITVDSGITLSSGSLDLPNPATVDVGGTPGIQINNNNTAIGYAALANNTSGSDNTANGYAALGYNTSGFDNTANGAYALYFNTNGSYNAANGEAALANNTSGSENTANGYSTLFNNVSGSDNMANGAYALYDNASGSNNIALGYYAGAYISGSDNIDIGNDGVAGESGVIRIGAPGIQTNAYIAGVIIGNGGGLTNLNAAQLNGIVPLAQMPAAVITNNEDYVTLYEPILSGTVTVEGSINANYGLTSDNGITINSGSLNLPNPATVDVGGSPGIQINGTNYNTAIGLYALSDNTSGYYNTANGYGALNDNTLGYENTANGAEALEYNTSGSENAANGAGALEGNTSGSENTANGYAALEHNTSGSENTANGYAALAYNTSGSENTANGAYALEANTNGSDNTANGYAALANNTNGSGNIAIGYQAGANFTGDESDNIDIGNDGVAGESDIIRIGTQGTQTATYLSGDVYATSFNETSDRNSKENFTSINPETVLAKVDSLPLTKWNYKTDKSAEHIGPMAQDFQAAFGLNGRDDKHISVVDEGGVALAAIQGLNEKAESQIAKAESENRKAETQIEQLKAENAELKAQLTDLAAAVKSLEEKSGR